MTALILLCGVVSAPGQTPDTALAAARKAFESLPVEVRLRDQVALAATGDFRGQISPSHSAKVDGAIRAFQERGGWNVTGRLDNAQRSDLAMQALPTLLRLGFVLQKDPNRKHLSLWVPARMKAYPEKGVLFFRHYTSRSNASLTDSSDVSLADLERVDRSVRGKSAPTVLREYRTKTRIDILSRSSNGSRYYSSMHGHRRGAAALFMSWYPIAANDDMEAAAVIMSGSLAASIAGLPFLAPPVFPEDIDRLYVDAEKGYNGLAVRDRLVRQILLTATGNFDNEINAPYSLGLYQAAGLFQAEHGRPATGKLDEDESAGLALIAAENLRAWNFQLTPHPSEGRAIWLPRGLSLKPEIVGRDLKLANGEGLSLTYENLPAADLPGTLAAARRAAETGGGTVLATVLRQDHYQLLAADSAGQMHFTQYHRHDAGLLGVRVTWPTSGDVPMERVVNLIAASLRHEMAGRAFPAPAEVLVAPVRKAAAPREGETPKKGPGGGSGTGFFVSADGHVLTNAHVAGSCGSITVQAELGAASSATLVAADHENDMALLKTSFSKRPVAPFRETLRVGEGVAAFGYPLVGTLTNTGNFTLGNVAALEGIKDDERFNQITAPVQPGNSGGPLVDMSGSIAGVVTLKLNAARVASRTGDIPQNVNFALKPAMASDFLKANGVTPQKAAAGATLTPSELAEKARDMSILIYCLP